MIAVILFPAGYEMYRKVKMKLLILIKCLSLYIYHFITDKLSLQDKKERNYFFASFSIFYL